MECTCVCLCLSVSMCLCVRVVGGEWVVKVVARSEEYKCIYMFGGESGKLLSYLRLGARTRGEL